MKKKTLLPALVLLPALSLAALPEFSLSAGGGLTAVGLFTSYTINTANESTSYGYFTWLEAAQKAQQFSIGGFLFFDATYGVLSVDMFHGFNSYEESIDVISTKGSPAYTRRGTGSETMLGFTLLGKYPFRLRDNLVLYPLAGIQYQIALSEKRKDQDLDREYPRAEGKTEFPSGDDFRLSMWNAFFVKIGAGMDYYFQGPLQGPLFFRAELLYSFRLMTPYERAAVDYLMDEHGMAKPKLFRNPGMRGLTHGPELRLALGYRFK